MPSPGEGEVLVEVRATGINPGDHVSLVRAVAFITGGVALILLGVLLMAFGAQAAVLEICSPPSSACQASLGVQDLVERFYSPRRLVLFVGVDCVAIGVVLSLRARRSSRHRFSRAGV
jgi:hypothetical protein